MHSRSAHLNAATMVAFIVVSLLSFIARPSTAHAFITAGAEAFMVATGTVDTTLEHTPANDMAGDSSGDETSGMGVSVYGLVGGLPLVDVGLALHYLPTLEITDTDKTTHKLGSETDLNLMVGLTLPIPAILVAFHGEGGLTLYSPEGEFAKLADDFDTDETAPVGYNAGGGVRVGYSIVPMISLVVGLDYQYYAFEVFSGSKASPGVGTESETLSASGSRVKVSLGVNFDL